MHKVVMTIINKNMLNKPNKIFFILWLFIAHIVSAQQLILSGKILYERKENLHKQLSENSTWSDELKKKMPKYRTDIFQLTYNKNKSLYKLLIEEESQFTGWGKVAVNNTVSNDLIGNKAVSEKTIYDKTYKIIDSLPVYNWKLHGDFRTIAGHTCRKASTIIMDSLYIIAFYTDEIPISGGPESFQGLPGMILGIVIPRLNITLFATKIETTIPSEKDFEHKPNKEKPMNRAAFLANLNTAIKDWGEYAIKVFWKAML